MERRLKGALKPSPLPSDFLKLLSEVLTTNFTSALEKLSKEWRKPHFETSGWIYSNEVILAASVLAQDKISATTVYASVDYDPKASSPTVQDLLSACVDALGGVLTQILSDDQIEMVMQDSLSAFENVPFEWTSLEIDRQRVYVRIDKANPTLEQQAEDWLNKNDPDQLELEKAEMEEAEAKFITGPSHPTRKKPGTVH